MCPRAGVRVGLAVRPAGPPLPPVAAPPPPPKPGDSDPPPPSCEDLFPFRRPRLGASCITSGFCSFWGSWPVCCLQTGKTHGASSEPGLMREDFPQSADLFSSLLSVSCVGQNNLASLLKRNYVSTAPQRTIEPCVHT